jgi:hypothetical protein
MNIKNHGQYKKPRFQRFGLIFYCYLLIPLNELAINSLKINRIKIQKKIIDISMRSMGNAGKGIFNYELLITNNFSEANYDGHPPSHPTFGTGSLNRGESGLSVFLAFHIFCSI